MVTTDRIILVFSIGLIFTVLLGWSAYFLLKADKKKKMNLTYITFWIAITMAVITFVMQYLILRKKFLNSHLFL